MKVQIRDKEAVTAPEVEILCSDITDEVLRLERYIKRFGTSISARDNGEMYKVDPNEILWIESVDKKTYIYTHSRVLSSDKRLYELETVLDEKDFFRCSKSAIVNLNKVVRLKPEITRSVIATLSNGENVVISRRYAGKLRSILKAGE